MPNKSAKERHAHMVSDPRRTPALLRTVAKAVKPSDTVIDIGTGLGILAIAAVKAGAKHVFAIETDKAALNVAKKNAKKAGAIENISFVNKLSFDVELPKRVDVILCETVGSCAFDENILATLTDAKKRLLKRSGRIIPTKLELWGAPIGRMPKVDEVTYTAAVKKQDLLAKPVMLKAIDFSVHIPKSIHIKTKFTITTAGTAHAVALWPKAFWWGKEVSDASPLAPITHWKQGILPLEPKSVLKGHNIDLELIIGPHPDDPKTKTDMLWRWG
ncbi:MAG: 50S ribosomal protein L11 methyltransferase [Pseudomonadota bacterium]